MTSFDQTIRELETVFRLLENQLGPPANATIDGREAFRFREQSIEQAMLLKVARYISGLNAGQLLLANGYLQELGVLNRTLDDLGDDITFLAMCRRNGPNKLCRKYLKVFWQEEFEEGVRAVESTKKRYQISRPEIRQYISSAFMEEDGRAFERVGNILSQAYSGYVHASAPHIIEMYEHSSDQIALRGHSERWKLDDHTKDFWNYVYRGLLATQTVAEIFDNAQAIQATEQLRKRFELASGTSYMDDVRRNMND